MRSSIRQTKTSCASTARSGKKGLRHAKVIADLKTVQRHDLCNRRGRHSRRTRRASSSSPLYAATSMGEYFIGCRQRRPDHLRRPDLPRPGLPGAVSAPQAAPGPGGLPGRHLSTFTPDFWNDRPISGRNMAAGPLTSLPIVETEAQDISGYIPTQSDLHHGRAALSLPRGLFPEGHSSRCGCGQIRLPPWGASPTAQPPGRSHPILGFPRQFEELGRPSPVSVPVWMRQRGRSWAGWRFGRS